MMEWVLPAVYAVFVWYFATGIILFLDGLPPASFRWSLAAATVLLFGAAWDLRLSAADPSVGGAYTAFTCAILIWGWLEMSFLMGFVTGPRKHACREHCGGWAHFVHATEAIIYNELATLLGGALIAAVTWAAPNRFGLYTYLVLWAMRLSAKLNLFLGVLNTGEQFLPDHLRYLRGFFRRRRMNFLFPLSICGSTTVAVLLAQRALAADDAFSLAGYTLVTSLLALAILEHWFMVLPIPTEKLWGWGFRTPSAAPLRPLPDPIRVRE
jgi:putative photosynthetic complex assembly protein 2